MKTKSILFALAVATSTGLPIRAVADGGWLNKKWDPSSTNSIPRLAMPATVSSPNSARKGKAAPVAAKSVKTLAAKSLLGASGSVTFSPSGLSGQLPTADDSRIQDLARGLDHN